MDQLIVATNDRGAAALEDLPWISVVPWGDPAANAAWRRAPLLSATEIVAVLPSMPGLRWLHTDSAGVDDLPLDLLSHVTITKTEAYAQSVAEWAVTAVLLAAKGLPAYIRASDARRWEPGAGRPRLIQGTHAVIVGAGAIGNLTADLLDGLGVITCAVGRRGPDWRKFLGPADWLILACPLTDETRHMVTFQDLTSIATAGWLINLGRGELLAPEALETALDTGFLGGAVLDSDDGARHWGRENVIVLPHDTWRATGTSDRQRTDFLDQARRFRGGLDQRRTVNLILGY